MTASLRYNPYIGDNPSLPIPVIDQFNDDKCKLASVQYLPEMSFRLHSHRVDYGSPIFGEIVLLPRRKIKSNTLRVRIVAEQCATTAIAGVTYPRSFQKRYADTVLKICDEPELAQSKQYTLPFCIEFPTHSDHKTCACGTEQNRGPGAGPCHEVLPPSLGIVATPGRERARTSSSSHSPSARLGVFRQLLVKNSGASVSYFIEGVLDQSEIVAYSLLSFRPSAFLMNLNLYTDKHGQCLDRVYYSKPVSIFKRRRSGSISFSVSPVYHDLAALKASAYVTCHNENEGESIERIIQYVHKRCHAHPNGTPSDLSSSAVEKYPIAYGQSTVNKALPKGDVSMEVSYVLARNRNLIIIPSYVSCLTGVTYELELIFKCTSGKHRLIVPLVCASSLDSFSVAAKPDEECDFTFSPTTMMCPSLVEDRGTLDSYSSGDENDSEVFTLES